MPEPITTITVGVIAWYLADKVAGKAIGDSSAALWGKIKQWFKGDEVLSILEKAPDSATQQDALAAKLDQLIKQQPETLKEIESLLNQLPYGTVSNVANNTGVGNLAFQNITNSTISASITIGKSGEYREHKEKLDLLKELFDKTPLEDTQKRLELSQKINEQESLIESFKQDILKLAETFDKIELNTERLQKAKEHFDNGEITEARVLLEDAEEERSDFVTRSLGKQKEYEEKILPGLQNAAAEYLILAQATALDFENPNRFEDTSRCYEQSIAAYSSIDNVFAYAYFLAKHNQFQLAAQYYRILLDDFGNELLPETYIRTLNNLASLHHNLNEFETAEKEYAEVLERRRELVKKDPDTYLPDLGIALNNIANLHTDLNQYEAAEKEFIESLEIRRKLVEQYGEMYLPNLAKTLNNLANLHRDVDNQEKGKAEGREAVGIYRELVKKDPQEYLPDMAMALNNLANLHMDGKDSGAAEMGYMEALEIYRELAKKNPQTYLRDMAMILNNLAGIYYARNEFDDVERIAGESLEIKRELAEKNPQVYLPDLALTLRNFALFYQRSKPDRERSIALALETVKILLPFIERAPFTKSFFYSAMDILKEWDMREDEIMAAINTAEEFKSGG